MGGENNPEVDTIDTRFRRSKGDQRRKGVVLVRTRNDEEGGAKQWSYYRKFTNEGRIFHW